MGKTQMVKKMETEASDDVLVFFRDVESVRTPLEFVELVFRDVGGFLSPKEGLASRARQLLQHLAGTEIGGIVKCPASVAPHWKMLLERIMEDLAEHQERPVVFFWDEVPYMLHTIGKQHGEDAAMEVLDVLRHLRQTHASLRMVFTGSIGLHNVITSLRQADYANDPTNDMVTIDVPPLSPAYGLLLARRLLDGEQIAAKDTEETARAIAEAVDHVAFYIHHVVSDLKFHGQTVQAGIVDAFVTQRLTDPQDPWHLAHYRDRIDRYYTPMQQRLALALLDVLAADERLLFEPLFNRVKARLAVTDEGSEAMRAMLRLLQRDHYIELGPDKAYRFRFPLIRRWWQLHRG